MTSVKWRTSIGLLFRFSAHLTILVALGLRLALPMLGPQAIGLQADHKHVVLGGSPAAKAQALARHRHVAAPDGDTLSITPAATPTTAHVISITGHDGLGPSVVETAAFNLHTVSLPSAAPRSTWGERRTGTVAFGEGVCLAIPSPPPRSSYGSA